LKLKYKKVAIVAAISMSLLAGCFGPKPEEELYVAFENAAKKEKTIFEDAKTLETLEKQGQELYSQIVKDGKDNNQVVKEKLDQAVKSVADREKVLDKEKETLDKAQTETKDVDKYVKELEDKKLQEQAKKVQAAYKGRYDTFKKMYDSYKKSLKLEKELYTMLQSKDEKLKAISEKVKGVNQSYQEIDAPKNKFNEYTKQYNEEKLSFYKQANIKIKEDKK